jgi:hypothetical protein
MSKRLIIVLMCHHHILFDPVNTGEMLTKMYYHIAYHDLKHEYLLLCCTYSSALANMHIMFKSVKNDFLFSF